LNNQQFRAVINNGGVCSDAISTITTVTTDPNQCCNNTDGNISASYSGYSTEPTHKNKFALTDTTGRILQISDTPQYSDLNSGWYLMYAITYDTLGYVRGLTVGADIDTLTGDCIQKSLPLIYKVCRLSVPKLSDTTLLMGQNMHITICLEISDSDSLQTHTASFLDLPMYGTSSLSVNNITNEACITYNSPNSYIGSDSLLIKVCNTFGYCDTARVLINIFPKPVAIADFNTTYKGYPTSGNVLTNDDDKNNPTTISLVTQPQNGFLTLNQNGTYTYTPNAGFVGEEYVLYKICNSAALCDTAVLSIKMYEQTNHNDPPIANIDVIQSLENIPVNGSVINNDFDPDKDVLRVNPTLVDMPRNGSLTMNTDGTFTYTPDLNYTGKDSFRYQLCDLQNLCTDAWAYIYIDKDPNSVFGNNRPHAQDDIVATYLNVSFVGILRANDSDPDATVNTLVYSSLPIIAPTHGTITINSNGSYVYVPANGYFGTDYFTYRVCDAGTPALCDTATVNVVVIPPVPDAENDINLTVMNVPVSGNILTNDNANELPFTLNTSLVQQPAHGIIVIQSNGSYVYTPDSGYVGLDNLKYSICNLAGVCDTAVLTINVLSVAGFSNNAPIANNDIAQTHTNVQITNNSLIANDFDPDADLITATLTPIIPPMNGSVSLQTIGRYTYTPDTNFTGVDSFQYQICDSRGACSSAWVIIDVKNDVNGAGNDRPLAQDDAFILNNHNTVFGNIKNNDSDPNLNTLTYSTTPIMSTTHGTLTINTNGTFSYIPNSGYYGTDQFSYQVCDNGVPSKCDTATVYIVVVNQVCSDINLKVMLEGPYNTTTGKMNTTLNQRGLLPGQTPIGQFAIRTPSSQPYRGAPWNYNGFETMTSYQSTVVDWILVTFRNDSLSTSYTLKQAALLHNDGRVEFVNPCFTLQDGNYFVVIEHRNHLGIMSSRQVTAANGALTYDFTTQDSYIYNNPPSFGQKLRGGKWMMFASDGKKDTYTTNFDINFNDSQLWKLESGIFDRYQLSDFNMDADVNFQDSQLWKQNSGKYSTVPH
jgi:hypothetical protein